jgi:hypothetical protein
MPDTLCRACGDEVKLMALCVKCGEGILYGCPQCGLFSETRMHLNCLNRISAMSEEII